MTVQDKLSLLSTPLWTNKDIMNYVGCSVNKATQIRQRAIMTANGLSIICPKMVKRDAVFKVLELDLNNEKDD